MRVFVFKSNVLVYVYREHLSHVIDFSTLIPHDVQFFFFDLEFLYFEWSSLSRYSRGA